MLILQAAKCTFAFDGTTFFRLEVRSPFDKKSATAEHKDNQEYQRTDNSAALAAAQEVTVTGIRGTNDFVLFSNKRDSDVLMAPNLTIDPGTHTGLLVLALLPWPTLRQVAKDQCPFVQASRPNVIQILDIRSNELKQVHPTPYWSQLRPPARKLIPKLQSHLVHVEVRGETLWFLSPTDCVKVDLTQDQPLESISVCTNDDALGSKNQAFSRVYALPDDVLLFVILFRDDALAEFVCSARCFDPKTQTWFEEQALGRVAVRCVFHFHGQNFWFWSDGMFLDQYEYDASSNRLTLLASLDLPSELVEATDHAEHMSMFTL